MVGTIPTERKKTYVKSNVAYPDTFFTDPDPGFFWIFIAQFHLLDPDPCTEYGSARTRIIYIRDFKTARKTLQTF